VYCCGSREGVAAHVCVADALSARRDCSAAAVPVRLAPLPGLVQGLSAAAVTARRRLRPSRRRLLNTRRRAHTHKHDVHLTLRSRTPGGPAGDGARAPHWPDQARRRVPPRDGWHRGAAHGAARTEEALPGQVTAPHLWALFFVSSGAPIVIRLLAGLKRYRFGAGLAGLYAMHV
jgi:hypothetical protein